MALQDRDSDGDGLVNVIDEDIDNDGQDNSVDFYEETFSAQAALYDYTNGAFVEIPLRIGFVNAPVLIERLYGNVGIFFSTELAHDYQQQPAGYILEPTNDRFADLPQNWKTWLAHNNKLLPGIAPLQEFDILFFNSGHVAVFVRQDGVDSVLEADASHLLSATVPLSIVSEREGGISAIGRPLPKPKAKQY